VRMKQTVHDLDAICRLEVIHAPVLGGLGAFFYSVWLLLAERILQTHREPGGLRAMGVH
jgi:hypothetical protein